MASQEQHGQALVQGDEELCTIEASVVTGFEESARGEAREKFNTDVKAARGRITWRVPLHKVNDVLKMGSVDNCKVVVHTVPFFRFTDQHDSLARLQKMVKDIDWGIGLRVWQRICDFPYPVAPRPDVIPSDDALVDVVISTHQPLPKDKSAKKNKKKDRWAKKKDKRNEEIKSKKENLASCDPAANIPADQLLPADQKSPERQLSPGVQLSPAVHLPPADQLSPAVQQSPADQLSPEGHENVAAEEPAESKSELGDSFEQSPRSPMNEKGDADVKKEDDMLASHEEEVVQKETSDSGMSKKDDDASVNRLGTAHVEPLPKLDSTESVDVQLQLSGKEGESLGKSNSESDEHLAAGVPDEATKLTPNCVCDNNVSPTQDSSADSSLSPVSRKFSESEFASIVISRLTFPQESLPKGDETGADSPMTCVTPPPTPIRSIDNPFSNAQSRLHAELLPFLDSTKLPDRGDSLLSSQQDNIDDSCSSDAPKLSPSASATQIESISNNLTSSNLPRLPSLSALATSAHATITPGSTRDLSAEGCDNARQQDVGDKSLGGEVITRADECTVVKKEHDATKPKFRVTCFRTGDSHPFDSTSAAASFGSAIVTYFGWQVDLKNFDIEIILNIDNEEVTVSLALTKMSLHYRNLVAFGPTTLRATICYNMLRLCRIKNGDFVCDPMCGTFAIPIEGALNWVNCFHFGGDIHEKAIEKVILNVAAVQERKKQGKEGCLKLDALQWDVQRLPLRDKCVDVFVSDLPFGHRMGSRSANSALYSSLLSEMARTARPGARACLLTEDKANLIKAIQNMGRYWQRRLILNINIGGLTGFVFLLTRTVASVTPSCSSWRDEGQAADEGPDGGEPPSVDSASVSDYSSVCSPEARIGTE
ncbi:hypothetical protein BsWGS_11843 [Bradybaena similaris]